MTTSTKPQDPDATACERAPQASVGTPVDLPEDLSDAHGTPVLHKDRGEQPVYDDRTDDRPAP